jgi:hypothetical protein
MKRIKRSAFVAVALTAAAPAWAAPVHVRGSVASIAGDAVSIVTDGGKTVGLTLGDAWKVGGVAPASLDAIKPGTFIGTANAEGPDGNKALEVVVFPEAMRGTGEGDYGWDLKPQSKMTNAAVTSEVAGADGPKLTLKYKGGEKVVSIPPGTPIVTIVPATVADLKAGTRVFVAGEPNEDGSRLNGGRIVVGLNGAVPPM